MHAEHSMEGRTVAFMGASCAGKTSTGAEAARHLEIPFEAGNVHKTLGTASGELDLKEKSGEASLELHFLAHHLELLRALDATHGVVTDTSAESDVAYARHYLSEEGLQEFWDLYYALDAPACRADLTVMLSVPAELLVARKRSRYQMQRRADDAEPNKEDLAGIQLAHEDRAEELEDAGVILRVGRDESVRSVAQRSVREIRKRL